MRIKAAIVLLLVIVSVVFNSCCKKPRCKCNEQWGQKVDDCTPKHFGPYYLGEVKDYLYFKPGSWWVYQNNLSGEIDSIYTILCDTAFVELTGRDKKWLTLSYTSIGFRMRSEIYDIDYFYEEQPMSPDYADFSFRHSLHRTARNYLTPAFSMNCFTYPFANPYSPIFKEFIPALVIKGKTYTDVVVFSPGIDESVSHPVNIPYTLYFLSEVKYFWAKNYGLVKIEARTYRNDTGQEVMNNWELTKCNLVK